MFSATKGVEDSLEIGVFLLEGTQAKVSETAGLPSSALTQRYVSSLTVTCYAMLG